MLAIRLDKLSSIPRIHVVERDNQILQLPPFSIDILRLGQRKPGFLEGWGL